MSHESSSLLTRERPDIWVRALTIASDLTSMQYLNKYPTSDGVIYACGGGVYRSPEEDAKSRKEKRERIEGEIKNIEEDDERVKRGEKPLWGPWVPPKTRWRPYTPEERVEQIRNRREEITHCLSVLVPEGAMEWLLHEVGHWVAASSSERLLSNYGLVDEIDGVVGKYETIACPTSGLLFEREWQAWAFEGIVLAPFGYARSFAPPTQRDGVAYAKAGTIPTWALAHAERQMRAARIDVELWRSIYGEWVQWGKARNGSVRPWDMTN